MNSDLTNTTPPPHASMERRMERMERVVNGVPEEDQPGLRKRVAALEKIIDEYVAANVLGRLKEVELTVNEVKTAKIMVRGALIYMALSTAGTGLALYQIAKSLGMIP